MLRAPIENIMAIRLRYNVISANTPGNDVIASEGGPDRHSMVARQIREAYGLGPDLAMIGAVRESAGNSGGGWS